MIIKASKPAPEGKPMPIGPHKGDLIESVIIKYPDFIFWLADRDPSEGFQWLYKYIAARVAAIDAKPFTNAKCAGTVDGEPCNRPVTRFSLYKGQSEPVFWCAECDHLQLGGAEHKMAIESSYYDALRYLDRNGATRDQKRNLIRRLAEAKGLTGNVTDQKVLTFFYPPAPQQ